MEHAQIAELKRFAKELEETGRGEETRAAARAILLLADEVESLTRELADASPPGEDRLEEDGLASWFRRTFSTGSLGKNGSD